MKTSRHRNGPILERRAFLRSTVTASVGFGLAAPAIVTRAAAAEPSIIAQRDRNLPFIAIEETYTTDELIALNAINDEHVEYLVETGLLEIGAERLGKMDAAGIDMQILSAHTPGVQNVGGQEGIEFAYRLNRMIAKGPMASHPRRYRAYATLPLQEPEASTDELERAVREDGFVGAMTNGFVGNRFLDHPDFEPLLARAEALGVPIYLHPGFPPKAVYDIYYDLSRPDHDRLFQSYIFSGSGYGWHQEVVTQCLRLIITGAFDRHSDLQMIVGHMGEGLPFYYERIVGDMAKSTEDSLDKPLGQYFADNFWYTTSAFFQDELLHLLLRYVSVDRVMFGTDYPFADMTQGTDWFRAVDLPRDAKEKIAFRNAQRLFGIEL
ncbi:amidohydrolase family protein [uncultured Jannaschia sp.]|uniref:amidohydrolase family protein n=1 Tax=uncultured Jannaschia sp. TaxID=293347 RepID=UPI002637CC00|nr:amidohydrolase family protein [uncultured Jannaschia sp.]